jgi:hypothetical protein
MRPFCYFFDIDGTMIGDISPQVYEWDILSKYDTGKLPQLKKNICSQLSNGLLRKGLSTFMDFLRARHGQDGCEFFVYTASDTKWANFIVTCIETVIGQKFNRPLFTRPNCIRRHGVGEFKKSLTHILPRVINKLRPKYGDDMIDVMKQCILIDNNRVLMNGEEGRLILCPTYGYVDLYDILRLLPEETLQKNFIEIASTLQSHGLFPDMGENTRSELPFHVFKAIYYSTLGKLIKENIKQELSISEDAFWTRLGNVLHALKDPNQLRDGTVRSVNDALNKNVKT